MIDQEKEQGTEPEQQDFTRTEFNVIYQGKDQYDYIFTGEDKVVANDPRDAAMRVLEAIVSRTPNIAHIRALEVQIPSTEDFVTFCKQGDPWPPNPDDGPCLSPRPQIPDTRIAKATVNRPKRVNDTKDGSEILVMTFRLTGTQAVAMERALLEFKPAEQLVMTLVAAQADFTRPGNSSDSPAFEMDDEDAEDPDDTDAPADQQETSSTAAPEQPEDPDDDTDDDDDKDEDEDFE